ncbi:dipeptide/oligopeptide/nickel ABC transporter permease/ATP-binding protein [Thermopolyspora sp. NPDC052614]|uniref:dipeptide/oligopeptide/nickel ABC transporter permease/ATP-binding protein n=1 Tax=Thermopolyspora sp. NPDC052614 TaxID=3155682 RepID=UPI00343445E0
MGPMRRALLVLIPLFLVLAVVGPVPAGPAADRTDVAGLLQGPSSQHWLGTDHLGRDILAQIIVASRLSLGSAVAATAIAAVAGIALGGASLARRVGPLFTAMLNVLVAFPSLLLAIFFAVIFGVGTRGAVLAVGLAMAPSFGRLTQTLGASVMASDYVSAARLLGLRHSRVLIGYVLPNVAGPLLLGLAFAAGNALVVMSGLSFLGLGVQPPEYDWGQLLQSGLSQIYTAPAAALGPALAIMLAGMTFSMVGEHGAEASSGVRRALRATARGDRRPVPAVPEETTVAEARGLRVAFPDAAGRPVTVVDGVDLSIGKGERVGLVGESGSGKSVTALALAGLVPHPGVVTADSLSVAKVDVLDVRRSDRDLKGRVAMVFQDPTRAMNPVLRVGTQIAEASAGRDVVEALRALKVASPALRARQYPHQLSGGTLQRAMIAMALAAEPDLLIADEPTTALDMTVQRATLRVLREAVTASGSALLFISHDIAVVSGMCERLIVMYAGGVVEDLPVRLLPGGAAHPYTAALLATLPSLDADRAAPLPVIPGSLPAAGSAGPGCAFAPRCPRATDRCLSERPPLADLSPGHRAACWHPLEGVA